MSKIVALRSGGQSGADRGSMDAARRCGVCVEGWCPAGGWAEDYPDPPGVLALYPELNETPSRDVLQRTEWNIRDSTCCVVLNTPGRGASPGTDAGYVFNEKYGIPHLEIEVGGERSVEEQLEDACEWLRAFEDDAIVLGFGGPRESEFPGIYEIAFSVAEALLKEFASNGGSSI